MHAQFQWSCSGDFRTEFTAYHRKTEEVTHPQIKRHRERILRRQWQRMLHRELRREHLVLFISAAVADYSGNFQTRESLRAYYEKLLAQLRAQALKDLGGELVDTALASGARPSCETLGHASDELFAISAHPHGAGLGQSSTAPDKIEASGRAGRLKPRAIPPVYTWTNDTTHRDGRPTITSDIRVSAQHQGSSHHSG